MKKAYFFPRITAYVIDILIISLLSALITIFLPADKNLVQLNEEYKQLQTDYLELKIDKDIYVARSVEYVYEIDYANTFVTIIQLMVIILYFIVFQFYNKGQTLGKKIMKVKVVSSDGGELSMNQFVYRSLIIHAILVNMIMIGCVLFMSKTPYYYTSVTFQFVQMILVIGSLLMVSFRKDGKGLHDLVAKTQVVMVD